MLVKLLVSLGCIIVVNKLTRNLFASLLAGSILFGLWSGQTVRSSAEIIVESVSNWDTITLIILVGLVIILSGQMGKTGLVHILVKNVRSRVSTKTSMALLPAIIGLLPMPGGALFSAPLLDSFDGTDGVNPLTKTKVNYWFRHIWEYGWPLYPGVILTCAFAGIEIWVFFLTGLPVTLFAVFLGYAVFMRSIPSDHHEKDRSHPISYKPFIPISIVIAVYLAVQFLLPAAAGINRNLPMILGLAGAVLSLQLIAPLSVHDWKSVVFSKSLALCVMIIVSVRIYGAFIEAEVNGTPVIWIMTREMSSIGIPPLLLIMGLPFISGLTMGLGVGFVGASMPIVVALAGSAAGGELLGYVILAYICGFMGTMLSPLHVCLIVTCAYFKTLLTRILASVLPPALIMIAFGFFYRLVLMALL